ncbi:MAG: LysE family transporter [Chloroflexi bacterium]|jgi:threonine/homoserine/homoserine lactone efflux protein|nr:LysE family transporter [Chloroflexota bacterium]
MDTLFFFKGLVLGFSIAAPVGPIGVLCIRRTLAEGRLHGLISGLGAATADGFYGLVAGFGLSMLSGLLVEQQRWLALLGGLYLLYLGIKTLGTKPGEQAASDRSSTLWGAYFSTLVLTLTNPVTILSFVAIFAGLGMVAGSYMAAASLVAGVFLGSAAWWLTLSGGVSLLRNRVTPKTLVWINRVAGAVLLVYGVIALISSLLAN